MKRTLTITARVLIFLIGFIFALYYFMDWGIIGKFAVSAVHSRLERLGFRMEYSDVTGENDGFTVNNLRLNGAANISFGSITIRPRIIPSILGMSAVCDINFRDLNIRLGQGMNFGDGRVLLTAGRNEILLENLRTNGEFSLNGYMSINTDNMRLQKSDTSIDIPESFADNMGMLQNFLPLVREGNRWYIRRR
jgi:hypothetical protein